MADPSSPSRSRSPKVKCEVTGSSGSLIGLDFDCTITVRHFYKSIANLLMGKPMAHPHCAFLNAWLKRHNVKLEVPPQADVHLMVSAVEHLSQKLGPKFQQLIREVFMGGEERIQQLTTWFARKEAEGITFAIITAGIASTVSMALEAVPEWDRFFPTDLVLDLSNSRHQVLSVTGQKALMLRDLRPGPSAILLVDDSLGEDPIPSWILRRSQVKFLALPYEGTGLDLPRCAEVDAELLS